MKHSRRDKSQDNNATEKQINYRPAESSFGIPKSSLKLHSNVKNPRSNLGVGWFTRRGHSRIVKTRPWNPRTSPAKEFNWNLFDRASVCTKMLECLPNPVTSLVSSKSTSGLVVEKRSMSVPFFCSTHTGLHMRIFDAPKRILAHESNTFRWPERSKRREKKATDTTQ